MQILVVDESEKKAWRRSRRILAAALYRRGSRTFTGRLSKEGLQELVVQLKKAASKNTSVVFYRLTAHAEFEVVARVGNTSAWGEEGWFANRVSRQLSAPTDGFSAFDKLLRAILRLAALFHDLGKANAQFQAMLRGESGAQHLRHELVSLLMLEQVLGGLSNPFQSLAEDPLPVFAALDEAGLSLNANGSDGLERNKAKALLEDMMSSGWSGLSASLQYLVLTHHRQIDVALENTPYSELAAKDYSRTRLTLRLHDDPKVGPALCEHINAKVKSELENTSFGQGQMPWHNESWLSSVRASAASVLKVVNDNPGLLEHIERHPVEWVKTIALIARPTLIQADHLASAMKTPCESKEQAVFANTCLDKHGNTVLADSLHEHLLKTRYAVDPYLKGMTGAHKPLPSWSPDKSSALHTPSPERFRWQDEVARLIRSTPDIESRPFLALVVSSTGAGKTLAAPKLLAAAAGDKLRYTCALGLRSLTLQTGAAYRDKLKVDESTCMTVVGDALYAALTGSTSPPHESQGSESLEEGAALVLEGGATGEYVGRSLEFNEAQASALSRGKLMAMTETPLLVCTVDHVMGAAALSRGSDTRMSMRLATADLVLDEIDNYSLEDLQALGRLVHQAACHGRRVVLMSATVSDTVLKALHRAWQEGLKVWAMRTQRPLKPVVALVSNQVPSKVLDSKVEDVDSALDTFLSDIGQVLAAAPVRTRAKAIAVKSSMRETFQSMFEECIEFAREHHTVEHGTGQRLSAGFVRFNQVRHCRSFAKFLLEEAQLPEGVDIRIQCYHRRMPLLHLAYIEKTLNLLWSRSDDQAIFSHPAVRGWTTDASLKVIIVATTSIQETGRDHDYDWALTEPWSTRSLVQLAGRVRRHRGGAVSSPNVGVLTQELNQLTPNKGNTALELGSEPLSVSNRFECITGLRAQAQHQEAFRKHRGVAQSLPLGAACRTDWLPAGLFQHGIDARVCLRSADGRVAMLSAAEHYAQDKRMNACANRSPFLALDDIVGVSARSDSAVPLIPELIWNRHNRIIEFRHSTGKLGQFTLDPKQDFKRLVVVEQDSYTRRLRTRARPPALNTWSGGTRIKNVSRCLLRTDLLTVADVKALLGPLASDETALMLAHSFEAYLSKNGVDDTPVDFDPLLGADGHSADIDEPPDTTPPKKRDASHR